MYQEISAQTLSELIRSESDIELIDVREKGEWDMIRIPQARLMPLSIIESTYQDIDFSKPVYIFCRSGARSGQTCAWLESR